MVSQFDSVVMRRARDAVARRGALDACAYSHLLSLFQMQAYCLKW